MKDIQKIHKIIATEFENLSKNEKYKHVVIHAQTLAGETIFKSASGQIDSTEKPMTLETPFNIASVTKLYIASTVLMLEEENLLSLTDLVTDYISHPLLESSVFNPNNSITIYHLLSHSSGLPDYLEVKDHDKMSLFDYIVQNGDQSWTRNDFFDRVLTYGKPFFSPQPIDLEKKKVRYSDTNFQLLNAIIEKVTNQTIDKVFQEKIYSVLGLTSTFHEGTSTADTFTSKASLWAGQEEMKIQKALASFGDIYSTTEELLIFMRALLSGTLFKDSNTTSKMKQQWNNFGFQLVPTSPGWPIQYGLGMIRLHYPKFLPPFKRIPEFYGHTGVTGSWAFFVPELEMIVVGDVGQLSASALPYQFMTRILSKAIKIK